MNNNSSSIDENELGKFKRTYKEWWDKDGEFKMLHKINPARLGYIKDVIINHFKRDKNSTKPLADLDILDVGCGGGLVSVPIHKIGANVTGLDANESNIIGANQYIKDHNLDINFVHRTAEEHQTKEIKYDVILALEIIEHVANPHDFIENLSEMLKKNGILIMSTINRNPKSYSMGILMAEYVLRLMPKGTHDYAKFIKPSELVKMAGHSELDLKELKGLNFSLITRNWRITDNIDINYFAVFTA